MLRGEGFDVTLAEDGPRALASVEESAPDVLVTDLRMPGLDGIELLRRARAFAPELIVVLVTAFADVETAVRAMHEGAEHYLTKPLQIDELVLVIRRALEGRKLRDEATQLRTRLKEHLSFENIIGSEPGDAGGVRRDYYRLNVIERAVVLCDSAKLTARHLSAGVGAVAKGSVHIRARRWPRWSGTWSSRRSRRAAVGRRRPRKCSISACARSSTSCTNTA